MPRAADGSDPSPCPPEAEVRVRTPGRAIPHPAVPLSALPDVTDSPAAPVTRHGHPADARRFRSAVPHPRLDRGDILRPLLATTALATLVTVLHESVLPFRYSMTVTPFSLIGLTLAIFLGFRNSVSYDRYWEGRKALGRTAERLPQPGLTGADDDRCPAGAADARPTAFVHRLMAFAHALRHHPARQ